MDSLIHNNTRAMSTNKYDDRLDELPFFMRGAGLIGTELFSVINRGLSRLEWGMNEWKNVDKKPSFPPSPPSAQTKQPYSYNEKNFYVNASNNLWYRTFWQIDPLFNYSFSEIYYQHLLNRIEKFEDDETFLFNKGIVYGNLGVSQSIQMKLDAGFANILKALIDDQVYSTNTAEFDTYKRKLFTQFEELYVRTPLKGILSRLNLALSGSTEQFIDIFLESLEADQRAFFDYTFARIYENLIIWGDKQNSFTAIRLLANTQDLCLFNEDLLKSKIEKRFQTPRKGYWTLSDLIRKEPMFKGTSLSDCKANTMSDLNKLIPPKLAETNQPQKCLRILLTLRNFSSHNIAGGTDTDCLYNNYPEILDELIRALYYISCL